MWYTVHHTIIDGGIFLLYSREGLFLTFTRAKQNFHRRKVVLLKLSNKDILQSKIKIILQIQVD